MRTIAESDDPGSLARDAYTYLHLPIIAGIIMVAIADDLLVAHPSEHLTTTGVVMATAGPAVYLLGESMVRLRMIGRLARKRLACVVALVVLGLLGGEMSALALTICVGAVLGILALWEAGRLAGPTAPAPVSSHFPAHTAGFCELTGGRGGQARRRSRGGRSWAAARLRIRRSRSVRRRGCGRS